MPKPLETLHAVIVVPVALNNFNIALLQMGKLVGCFVILEHYSARLKHANNDFLSV